MMSREERREYDRERRIRKRKEWLDANGPCTDCGSWENLEIDHVDPSQKLLTPAFLWNVRKELREVELAKCIARCKNCHLAKSIHERPTGEFHVNSKVTDDTVEKIRALYATGEYRQKDLVQMFEVSKYSISRIVRNKVRVKGSYHPRPESEKALEVKAQKRL